MIIEPGKYYIARNGLKIGPMLQDMGFFIEENEPRRFWHSDGRRFYRSDSEYDLVKEFEPVVEGTTRLVINEKLNKVKFEISDGFGNWSDTCLTMNFGFDAGIKCRSEIIPGSYGIVNVECRNDDRQVVSIVTNGYNADQLREAAHILNQIAEVLESDGTD